MKAVKGCFVALLLFLGVCHAVLQADEALKVSKSANKLLFDLQMRAKAKPESKDYVFSADYMGVDPPQIDCDYVEISLRKGEVSGSKKFPRVKMNQESIYSLTSDVSQGDINSFAAAMGRLGTSGSYEKLSYEEERFGPDKTKAYRFDFFANDGKKKLTRWFDAESGHEVGVATYGSDGKVNLFKFHLKLEKEIKKIDSDDVGASLTYEEIAKVPRLLRSKDDVTLDLHKLSDVQLFAVQVLKYVQDRDKDGIKYKDDDGGKDRR